MNNKYIKDILNLAWPVLFTNFLFILFDILDKAIIGRLGINEIAESSLISNYIYYITGSLGFISSAFIINLANNKKYEEDSSIEYVDGINIKKVNKYLACGIFLSLFIGVLFTLIHILWGKQFLEKIYGIYTLNMYLYLISLSVTVLLNLLTFLFSSYFRYLRKPKIIFTSVLIATTINILLDYTLAFGKLGFPKLGALGTALGSIIGLLFGIIFYLLYYRKINKKYIIPKYDFIILKGLINSYIPLFLQDFIESNIFLLFINYIISFSTHIEIGVYALLNSILNIFMLPILAVGGSASLLFGQNKKIYEKKALLKYNYILIVLSLLLFNLIILIFNYPIASILTDKQEIIKNFSLNIFIIILIFTTNALKTNIKSFLIISNLEKWVCNVTTIIYILGCLISYCLFKVLAFKGILISLCIINLLIFCVYLVKAVSFTRNYVEKS